MDEALTPNAGQNIISRGLPKTGQVISYSAGDDGDHEAGWWPGRLNANNKTRFIQKTIGGDDIVFDRATGLMWATDCTAAGGNGGIMAMWGPQITYANGLTFAGFSDWRMPNIIEFVSFFDYSSGTSVWQIFISNQINFFYWTSTAYIVNPIDKYMINPLQGNVSHDISDDNSYRLLCVRGGI